ncbi:MAG: guanylate kinase [Desulfovibrionaceae bacterium]|nr:guanylate kinase [Desulfovibrionaceae bacterium]
MNHRKGIVFVVSAPSGAGKTTLIRKLLDEFTTFSFSISYTTRKPRPNERDGEHYHFVTEEEFLVLKNNNFFVEWAYVHGAYYGSPLEETQRLLDEGKDILFDIDVQGAEQLYSVLKQGFYVFIIPPSYTTLVERLQSRGTEDQESIARRLNNAEEEIRAASWFSAWIVNDDLNSAYEKLRSAYITATLSPMCNPNLLEYLMQHWKA